MPEVAIAILRPTPSLNELLSCPPRLTAAQHAARNRRYWRGRSGWGGWVGLLLLALEEQAPSPYPRPGSHHVTVTITRYGARELDVDNLVGGSKGLVDCLRALSLLVDDSPEWATLLYRQHAPTPTRERRTEIHIQWEDTP